jgi:hypothetical protein
MDSMDTEETEREQGEPHAEPIQEEPMLFCPVCSQRLTELKCKLVCSRCGYYMSCADYY